MSSKTNNIEKDMIDDDGSGMSQQTNAVDAWTAISLGNETETQVETTAHWNDSQGPCVEIGLKMPYGNTMINLDADEAKEFAQSVMNAASIAEHRQSMLDDADDD
jgi:hypothetical protein